MRRFILIGVDVALIVLATLLALALRENFEIAQDRFEAFLPYLGATAIAALIFVAAAGLNRSIWRFSSMHDYLRVTCVVTAVCFGAVALSFVYNRLEGVARSLPFLQGIVGVMVLVGARVLHRLRHAARQQRKASGALLQTPAKASELSVLIVGVTWLTEAYVQALAELGAGRFVSRVLLGAPSVTWEDLSPAIQFWGCPKTLKAFSMALKFMGSPSTVS